MIAWTPLAEHRYSLHQASDQEKDDYTLSRYQDIATDLVEVLSDDKPLFEGELGKVQTGLLVLAIASFESGGFREDIDNVKGSGDHGQSHCIMQIMYPLRDGEVMNDRQDCFRIGLARIRESMQACRSYRLDERLAVYARGKCDSKWGIANSKMKMKRASYWLTTHPFINE